MEYQAFHNTPWLHGSFWVFIAIVIFALLAGRKIATVLTTMLDGRTAAITAALQEAAALKAQAEAMLADAQARQAQALRDAASIVANAHAEAERMAAALAAEAAATATRRERMAQERIAAAEAQALADIRATAIDVAAAASRALLQGGFGAEGDVARIDDAIAALPEALRKQVSSAF
jgi:F-type H+-transporting ATPase subunit b